MYRNSEIHIRWTVRVRRCAYSLIALLSTTVCCLSGEPSALQMPRLVASNVPDPDGWCGERSVYFRRLSRESILTLTLLNIDRGREKTLQLGNRLAGLLACSPDGRWAITEEGAHWRSDRGPDGDECDAPKPLELPNVTLWDTLEDKHYAVGYGVVGFEWSPDGKMVLYHFNSECDLDLDSRNSFHLPSEVGEFRAFSVSEMTRPLLGPGSGLPDQAVISLVRWLDDGRFLAQFSARKLNLSDGYGAVVTFRLNERSVTDPQQLNPREFRSSWVLAVPQVKSQASTDFLSAANCKVKFLGLSCSGNRADEKPIEFDLAQYCGQPPTRDVEAFCDPADKFVRWLAIRRGRSVLLERRSVMHAGNDLFWIDNENGELLK